MVLGRLAHERSGWETVQHELQKAMAQEVAAREQMRDSLQGFLKQEKDARHAMEYQLAQDSGEQRRQHAAVLERVEAVQHTVRTFDALIRTEVEERSAEASRLWAALDTSGTAKAEAAPRSR